jgi:uridine kinase
VSAPALDAVLELLQARPATLGDGRWLALDGPAGSGKTTLASAVAARVPGTRVVGMDDLFEGWSGLPRIDAQLGDLLEPLALGRPGSYRRWDWLAGRYAETVVVEPVPLLVLEGVGSGAGRFDHLRTVLGWVEAPYDLRLRRGLERDGDAFAPHWERWAADEQVLFTRERTRERADLLVDGRDGSLLPG